MISIAIDGPAGAGKSSIARRIASDLGFIYVDTGALYRAVALGFSAAGYSPETVKSADVSALLEKITVGIEFICGEQRVTLCGEDVTSRIRTPEVSLMASAVSALPEVRAFLLETQRRLSREHNVIMDGRDIGTVVLPNADIKIFLTASAEERARRRYIELCEKNIKTTYEEVLRDQLLRDKNDSTRAVAPLRPAEDAVTVDTTEKNFEQSCEALLRIIKDGLGI